MGVAELAIEYKKKNDKRPQKSHKTIQLLYHVLYHMFIVKDLIPSKIKTVDIIITL